MEDSGQTWSSGTISVLSPKNCLHQDSPHALEERPAHCCWGSESQSVQRQTDTHTQALPHPQHTPSPCLHQAQGHNPLGLQASSHHPPMDFWPQVAKGGTYARQTCLSPKFYLHLYNRSVFYVLLYNVPGLNVMKCKCPLKSLSKTSLHCHPHHTPHVHWYSGHRGVHAPAERDDYKSFHRSDPSPARPPLLLRTWAQR